MAPGARWPVMPWMPILGVLSSRCPPLPSALPAFGGQQLSDLDAAEELTPAFPEPAERLVPYSAVRLADHVGIDGRILDRSKEVDIPFERLEDVREREPLRLHSKEITSVSSAP